MWGFVVAIRTIAGVGLRQVVGAPGFAGECWSFVAEGYHPCSVGTRPLAVGKTGAGKGNRAGGSPLHTGKEKHREQPSLHYNSSAYHGCNVGKHPASVGLGWVPPPFRYSPIKKSPASGALSKE